MARLPLRNLFALTLVLVAGCAPGTTTNVIDGVSVTVLHARYQGRVESATEGNGDGGKPGTRYTHKWTSSDGASTQSYGIEIADSKFRVSGVDYGTVEKGDVVVIDGGKVTINGKVRSPE
jgi:hypothetical protein